MLGSSTIRVLTTLKGLDTKVVAAPANAEESAVHAVGVEERTGLMWDLRTSYLRGWKYLSTNTKLVKQKSE